MAIVYQREDELVNAKGVSSSSGFKRLFEWGFTWLFMAETLAWVCVRIAVLVAVIGRDYHTSDSVLYKPDIALGWTSLGLMVFTGLMLLVSALRQRSKFKKAHVPDPIINTIAFVIAPFFLLRGTTFLVVSLLERFFSAKVYYENIYFITIDTVFGVAYIAILIAFIRLAERPLLWDIASDTNRGFQPVPAPDPIHNTTQNDTTGYFNGDWKSNQTSPIGYNASLDKQDEPTPPINTNMNDSLYGHWRPPSLAQDQPTSLHGQLSSTISYSNAQPSTQQYITTGSHHPPADWRFSSSTSTTQPSVNYAGHGVPPVHIQREFGRSGQHSLVSSPEGSARDIRMSEIGSDTDQDTLRSYITGTTTKRYHSATGPADHLPTGARR
jgi:hypothetical protein